MSIISRAIAIAYPDAVIACNGTPFTRPAWTGDTDTYSGGFYWKNGDGDRFYSPTFENAAEDLANEIGMDESEAREVIQAGRAVA